jgi:hypothetical protein
MLLMLQGVLRSWHHEAAHVSNDAVDDAEEQTRVAEKAENREKEIARLQARPSLFTHALKEAGELSASLRACISCLFKSMRLLPL